MGKPAKRAHSPLKKKVSPDVAAERRVRHEAKKMKPAAAKVAMLHEKMPEHEHDMSVAPLKAKATGKVNPHDAETLKAIESIGSWAWAWKRTGWIGGEKLKAGGYSIVQNNTVFTAKGVDKVYPQYWSEWTPLIGKEVVMPTHGFMDDGNLYLSKIKVRANGTVVVQIPGKGDKDKADEWFENDFGWTLMHHPNKAVLAEANASVSDIKAKLKKGPST